jgi:hypothetical protein
MPAVSAPLRLSTNLSSWRAPSSPFASSFRVLIDLVHEMNPCVLLQIPADTWKVADNLKPDVRQVSGGGQCLRASPILWFAPKAIGFRECARSTAPRQRRLKVRRQENRARTSELSTGFANPALA